MASLAVTLSPLNNQSGRSCVAIVGFDTKTRGLAPWNDRTWDIWGLNGGHDAEGMFRDDTGAFRADRWFQIHPPETLSRGEQRFLDHLTLLKVPTFVRPQDRTTMARQWLIDEQLLIPYPIGRVRAMFPAAPFASTFCLELALAILEGYQTIGLFGIDSRDLGRELVVERPALAYWIGVAAGRGIAIGMPENSTLLQHPFTYGFDYLDEAAYAAMVTEEILPRRLITRNDDGNLNTVASVTAFAAKKGVS